MYKKLYNAIDCADVEGVREAIEILKGNNIVGFEMIAIDYVQNRLFMNENPELMAKYHAIIDMLQQEKGREELFSPQPEHQRWFDEPETPRNETPGLTVNGVNLSHIIVRLPNGREVSAASCFFGIDKISRQAGDLTPRSMVRPATLDVGEKVIIFGVTFEGTEGGLKINGIDSSRLPRYALTPRGQDVLSPRREKIATPKTTRIPAYEQKGQVDIRTLAKKAVENYDYEADCEFRRRLDEIQPLENDENVIKLLKIISERAVHQRNYEKLDEFTTVLVRVGAKDFARELINLTKLEIEDIKHHGGSGDSARIIIAMFEYSITRLEGIEEREKQRNEQLKQGLDRTDI